MRIGPFSISWDKHRQTELTSKEDLGRFVSILSGDYSARNMITLFESIPEVFAPIDTIAAAVCSAEWQLRRLKDDEVIYDNKDWNRLYERPNWKQDWSKFIYNSVVYKYSTGNRYLWAYVPETLTIKLANVANLWSLPPQYTTAKVKANRPNFLQASSAADLVDYYDFASDLADKLRIHPDQVVHDTYLDISLDHRGDILRGETPLIACEYPMSNLCAVYEARNVIYVKRGSLGFIVSKKGDASGLQALTKSEKEELLKDYHSTYGLKRGKSPVSITSLPVDFIKTGLSIKELEPFTETDASSDAIYAVLRVPRELKPRSQGATYENQKQASRGLYTKVAIPEAMQLAASISKLLKLADAGFYLFPCFDKIEDLQENKKEKSDVDWRNNETYRVRFLHGVITLNDWIAQTGGEPVTGVALYDKRIMEMDETELAIVKAVLSLKSASDNNQNNNNGNETNNQGN